MGERIINKARELYFSFGLKSVTMDALAKETGISKKTLYQHFTDKDEIIDVVVADLLESHQQQIESCRSAATNVVHEVHLQLTAILTLFLDIRPAFFNEMQKYFPEVWTKMIDHEKSTLLAGIQSNLQRGIAEGYYRNDLNTEITSLFRINQIRSLFNPASYQIPHFEIKKLAFELTSLYLHAITNADGRVLIKEYSESQL